MLEVHAEPFTVWIEVCIFLLCIKVADELLLLCINKKNASRHETALLYDLAFRNIKNTDFRRKDKFVVFCDVVAAWAETVAVKGCTDNITIREEDCGRSIPRLHHCCPVVVEILLAWIHTVIMFPWFRNTDHDSKWKWHSVHYEEFKSIVQHCRVGTRCIYGRKNLMDFFVAEYRGSNCFFAGKHSVCVTADCIDFTIVGDESVWMCTLP